MTSSGGQPWRILVVDDEENLNWSIVTSLRRERYAVDGVVSAEAALQRLTEQAYDCVISDVKMPGMDGFELLQWLRHHQPQTRVIMMTAFGSPTARQEALSSGVVAYLEKPFDLRVLKDELRRLAESAMTGAPAQTEGYDALDVAQVLNLTRRDIAIRIEGSGGSGILRFLRGELVAAEMNGVRGDEAFLALCVPRASHIDPEPWDGRTEHNISQPLSRLIFQALAIRERRTPPPAHDAAPATTAISLTPSLAGEVQIDDIPTAQMAAVRAARAQAQLTKDALNTAAAPLDEADLATSQPIGSEALTALTRTLASALPAPCGVVFLRADGTLMAESHTGQRTIPAGAYSHLVSTTQATLRALLVADWGAFEEFRVLATEAMLVVRRLARGERAVLCAVALPRLADPNQVETLLVRYESQLLAALR
jgi:CheY-like chemotaxis protein